MTSIESSRQEFPDCYGSGHQPQLVVTEVEHDVRTRLALLQARYDGRRYPAGCVLCHPLARGRACLAPSAVVVSDTSKPPLRGCAPTVAAAQQCLLYLPSALSFSIASSFD
jgi:hypothetical protein